MTETNPLDDPIFAAYRRGFQDGVAALKPSTWDEPLPTLRSPSRAVPTLGPPPAEWVPLRHTGNGNDPAAPAPCGEIGLYLAKKIKWGDKGTSSNLRRLNGWIPEPQERPVCGACLEPVNPYSATFFDYGDQVWELGRAHV